METSALVLASTGSSFFVRPKSPSFTFLSETSTSVFNLPKFPASISILYLPGLTFLNLKAPRLLVSVRCDSVPSSINRSTVVPPTFSPETSNTVPEIFRGFCPTRTVASAKSTNITLMNDLFNITFFAILSLPRIVWHLMSIVIRWRKFNHALRLNQVKNI